MLNMKKVLTLVSLGLALAITTATSKKTNSKPIEKFYTNYYVETNCTNSIAQSKIQVKTEKSDQLPISKIIDVSVSNQDWPKLADYSGYSFTTIGFNSHELSIGYENFSAEDNNQKCKIAQITQVEDLQISSRPKYSQYKLSKEGFFTKFKYDCYDRNQYLCSINLEELEPLPFDQVR